MEVIDKIKEMKIPAEKAMVLIKYVTENSDLTDIVHVRLSQFLIYSKTDTRHVIILGDGLVNYIDENTTDMNTVLKLIPHYANGFEPYQNEKITHVKGDIFLSKVVSEETYMFTISNKARQVCCFYQHKDTFSLQVPIGYDDKFKNVKSDRPDWCGYWVVSRNLFHNITTETVIKLYQQNEIDLLSEVLYDRDLYVNSQSVCNAFKCDRYHDLNRVTYPDNSFNIYYNHQSYLGDADLMVRLAHLYAKYTPETIPLLLNYVLNATTNVFCNSEMRYIREDSTPEMHIFRVLQRSNQTMVYNLCLVSGKRTYSEHMVKLPENTDTDFITYIYNLPEVAFKDDEFMQFLLKNSLTKLPPIENLLQNDYYYIIVQPNGKYYYVLKTTNPVETPNPPDPVETHKTKLPISLPTADELNANGLKKFQESLSTLMHTNDINGFVTIPKITSKHILNWLVQYCKDYNLQLEETAVGHKLIW